MPTVCSEHNTEYNKWGQCPDCRREAHKRYESTEKGKRIKRKVSQKRDATPEGKLKCQAHGAVRLAIRKGNLIKLPCQVCRNPKAEAHHYLGYAKEHALCVVFLCKKHHVLADRNPVFNKELKSKAPVE